MGMQATWIHDVTWEGMLRFDRKFVTMDVKVRRRKKEDAYGSKKDESEIYPGSEEPVYKKQEDVCE